MLYMVVDKSHEELKKIGREIEKVYPNAEIKLFQDPLLAFKYAFQNNVKTVYVNVKLPRIDGFELAKMLLTIERKPQVILLDDVETSKQDALRIGATGFLIKPITADKLKLSEEMEW